MPVQRILVPVDGSASALAALDFAVDLARQTGASLDVVTVLSLGELDFYDGMYLTLDQVESWQARLKAEIIGSARERIPDDVKAELNVLHGRIVQTILDRAAGTGASMIVMGRTGKGRIERAFKGSVAHQVSGRAEIPVTLVG